MKRKRVGAGQRGSSNPFMTAKDLLKPSMLDTVSNKGSERGGFYNDSSGGSEGTDTEKPPVVQSSIRVRANAAAASQNSPTKAGRATSKKQQKLAEAAKSSRNISQYFVKKQTVQKSQEEAEEGLDVMLSHTATVSSQENGSQQERSPGTVEAAESDEIQEECKTEVILIPDDEEEESHKTETIELERVQDTSEECMKSTAE